MDGTGEAEGRRGRVFTPTQALEPALNNGKREAPQLSCTQIRSAWAPLQHPPSLLSPPASVQATSTVTTCHQKGSSGLTLRDFALPSAEKALS